MATTLENRIQKVLNYTDFTPIKLDPRIIRFKDFTFQVGPTTAEVTEDSRLAEYKYLFTDGVEVSKVRGTTKVVLEGIAIPNSLKRAIRFDSGAVESRSNLGDAFGRTRQLFATDEGNIAQTAAQYFYEKMRILANGIYGVLVTPGLGTFSTALLTNYSFSEDGDNPRQLKYRLEFMVNTPINPVTKLAEIAKTTPAQATPTQQQNSSYTIVSGDTLSAIATRFGVSLSLLKAQNPTLFDAKHKNGNLIKPGEVVTVRKSSAYTETPTDFKVTNKASTTSLTGIPRDDRLKVMLENKGQILNSEQPNAIVAGIQTGVISLYSTINALSKKLTNLPFSLYYNPGVKGTFSRPTTTQDKYLGLLGETTTDKKAEAFPIFAGLIGYNEVSTIDSSVQVAS